MRKQEGGNRYDSVTVGRCDGVKTGTWEDKKLRR